MTNIIPTPKDVIDPAPVEPADPVEPVTDPVADPVDPPEPRVFDEAYVKDLRKESAGYRDKAKKVDEYGARLHEALVKGDGRLQDPTDLPYDAAHIEDPAALTAAVDELLAKKPHLASRRPGSPIPQGATPEDGSGFSLAARLRAGAGG